LDPTTAVWVVFAVYLAALVGLALATRRGSGSLSGFFLGGRKLPGWALAFSTNATGESGWLLLGLTGMGYLVGVHALWIVVGEIIGIGLSWGLVARRLRHGAGESDALTAPDYLAARFGDRSGLLRWVAVLIILAMVVTYTSAQVVATGKAFQTFVDWDYRSGAILGAVVALAYTTVGGFRAVVWTDVLQGVLMLGGLIALPIAGFAAAGGWDAVMESLRAQDPVLLDPLKGLGWTTAGIVAVATGMAVGLPFLGVPQLLVRYMAIRDERDVPQAAAISIGCLFVFLTGAVLTGMAGRALFPDLADHESVMPLMSRELFPPLVTGVLLTVVLAAIMSTVDSLVLLASSAVVRDIAQQALGVHADDHRLSTWSKIVTVLIGVIATAIALVEVRGIYWFVLFAWSGLGAAFGPVILCALFWKGMTRAGALAGMLAGFLTVVVWVVWVKEHAYGLYEAVPGFAAGFVAIVVVSLMTTSREADDDAATA
jgi:sodium/proline symporter